jgi:F-type H+-transporting ATPase subunit delta
MSHVMKSADLAPYAEALLSLAEERGQVDAVAAEVAALRQLLAENESFRQALAAPSISREARDSMLQRVLGPSFSSLVVNFLLMMSSKSRLPQLDAVLAQFQSALDERRGKIDVDVYLPSKLSDADLEDIRRKISASLKKDAKLRQVVDPSIIGGIMLRVGDQLIDGSVRKQLEVMKAKFLAAMPRA